MNVMSRACDVGQRGDVSREGRYRLNLRRRAHRFDEEGDGRWYNLRAPVAWTGAPLLGTTSQGELPVVAAPLSRLCCQAQHQWGTSVGAIGGTCDVGWRIDAMCHVSGRSADCCHIVGPHVVGALVKTLACCDCRTSCRPEDSGENEQGVAEDRMRRQFPPRRRARRSHSLPSSSRGSPPLLLRRQTTRGAVTTMGAPPPTPLQQGGGDECWCNGGCL